MKWIELARDSALCCLLTSVLNLQFVLPIWYCYTGYIFSSILSISSLVYFYSTSCVSSNFYFDSEILKIKKKKTSVRLSSNASLNFLADFSSKKPFVNIMSISIWSTNYLPRILCDSNPFFISGAHIAVDTILR